MLYFYLHALICFASVNPLVLRFDAFMDYSIPEILRVPLEELCLHIMVHKLDTHRYKSSHKGKHWYHKWKHYYSFCLRCSLFSPSKLLLFLLSPVLEMPVRLPGGLFEPSS